MVDAAKNPVKRNSCVAVVVHDIVQYIVVRATDRDSGSAVITYNIICYIIAGAADSDPADVKLYSVIRYVIVGRAAVKDDANTIVMPDGVVDYAVVAGRRGDDIDTITSIVL